MLCDPWPAARVGDEGTEAGEGKARVSPLLEQSETRCEQGGDAEQLGHPQNVLEVGWVAQGGKSLRHVWIVRQVHDGGHGHHRTEKHGGGPVGDRFDFHGIYLDIDYIEVNIIP